MLRVSTGTFLDIARDRPSATSTGRGKIFRMSNRPRLPDFGTYFQTSSQNPIDFTCRESPNLFHDLVFLKSYIHDSRFQTEDLRLQKKVLTIPLERDRWELFSSLHSLETIRCELTISPVLSVNWELHGKLLERENSSQNLEFRIRDIYLGESYWENAAKGEVVLIAHGKQNRKLRLRVRDPFVLRMQDQVPKKKNKK